MKPLILAGYAALALALCAPARAGNPASASTAAITQADVTAPRFGAWGYDLSSEDTAVSPGADFFRFVNGKWIDRTEIPADQSSFSNFDTLEILTENRARLIIETAAKSETSDPDSGRISAIYKAYMDEARVESLDAKPLAADLAAIRAARTRSQIARLMGVAPKGLQGALFDLNIQADQKRPSRYAVYMDTAGLGLPDRDYYIETAFAAKKAAYQAYVAQMLTAIGWPDPQGQAAAIVAFETRIAKVTWTRAERRDVDKTYNPMTVADLEHYAAGFDYGAFLDGAGLKTVDRVIVGSNTAFPKIAALYARTSIETLKAWQAFHLVDNAAPYLSDRFVGARFAFRDKTLDGQSQIRPRWKRAVDLVDDTLGEGVGRLYVARYFTPTAKAQMDALVGDLKLALHDRIEHLTWMEPATKARALEKLAKFTVKIGYPARWRDYSDLRVSPDDLFGDVERGRAFDWNRQVRRLNDPVDKGEWDMPPQTVNAYYNAPNNEVVFPAAILQPPFFDPDADPAVNFGGIGAVIGHEMTHGFDDQGRKSDGDGVLRDWWTSADAAKFKAQAARLGVQYSAFEPIAGVHVKGDQTMGENIADLGGLLMALDAYHASLNGQPAPVIDGLTGDQRVLLSFGQILREKVRDDALRREVSVDSHSPSQFRVTGTVRNVDAWYDAFGIRPTDPNYVAPDQRVRIW